MNHITYKEKIEAYLKIVEPYLEAKRRLYATELPTYVITREGTITPQYNFTVEQQKQLRLLDQAIDAAKTMVFKTTLE